MDLLVALTTCPPIAFRLLHRTLGPIVHPRVLVYHKRPNFCGHISDCEY